MSSEQNQGSVRIEQLDGTSGVCVVTIDFPPLNIGSLSMRTALHAALSELAGRPDIKGAILVGAGSNFVAGSDIREFDAPPKPPHLPDIIEQIERLPYPVIAAIRGAALGGGCELALGCDWRVAAPDAVMGLPEATLGLVPGAGGTVRLPRVVGAAKAIDLVSSGKRLGTAQALALGLVDDVAEGEIIPAALAWLLAHPAKRRMTALPVPPANRIELETAIVALQRKSRGADAPVAAAEAVLRAIDLDVSEALKLEREDSLRLRLSPQSKALRYLFQAERRSGRPPTHADASKITRVGVVGAGRMGSDIAYVFARAGCDVKLVEANAEVADRSRTQIGKHAERMVSRGELGIVSDVLDRIVFADLPDLSDRQLVIEAIPEDFDAKSKLFAALDRIVAADAILATNTSYLDIDALAAPISHPERVLGMHFFNPAFVLKLVEIVRADKTDAKVIASMLKLARKLGKLPILTGVGEGFVGNRIFAAYRRQCEYLIEDGCLPEQIDAAMESFGMAMGPFAVFDLAGLDIAWAMRKRLAATRDPAERYVEIPDRLCEEGRFGKKNGKGWYDYVDGRAVPSPEVTELIQSAWTDKNSGRPTIDAAEIAALLVTAMATEAAWVVHESVAANPEDVDVALCNGFGFPRHRGGPLYWAAQQDRQSLLQRARQLAASSGRPLAPDLETVLDQIACKNH